MRLLWSMNFYLFKSQWNKTALDAKLTTYSLKEMPWIYIVYTVLGLSYYCAIFSVLVNCKNKQA